MKNNMKNLDTYSDTTNATTYDAVKSNGNDGANYEPGEVPTHANSTKVAVAAFPADLGAPAPVGDASC